MYGMVPSSRGWLFPNTGRLGSSRCHGISTIPPLDRPTVTNDGEFKMFRATNVVHYLLKMCLWVIPFSVIVSCSVTTFDGMMYDCCSTAGKGGASNDVQTVLLACVFPSYSSTAAVIERNTNGWVIWRFYRQLKSYSVLCGELCHCSMCKLANSQSEWCWLVHVHADELWSKQRRQRPRRLNGRSKHLRILRKG